MPASDSAAPRSLMRRVSFIAGQALNEEEAWAGPLAGSHMYTLRDDGRGHEVIDDGALNRSFGTGGGNCNTHVALATDGRPQSRGALLERRRSLTGTSSETDVLRLRANRPSSSSIVLSKLSNSAPAGSMTIMQRRRRSFSLGTSSLTASLPTATAVSASALKDSPTDTAADSHQVLHRWIDTERGSLRSHEERRLDAIMTAARGSESALVKNAMMRRDFQKRMCNIERSSAVAFARREGEFNVVKESLAKLESSRRPSILPLLDSQHALINASSAVPPVASAPDAVDARVLRRTARSKSALILRVAAEPEPESPANAGE